MNDFLSIIYILAIIALGASLIYFGVKGFEKRKKEPQNYIEFHTTLNGRRVAYLHMSDPPYSNDDKAILKAFDEAIHLIYNDPTVDPEDFIIAWNAYNEFRDAVDKVDR